MGDQFDIVDISMLNYAEDLEIAPMDLMIIVRTVVHFASGLRSVNGAPAPSHTHRMPDALRHRATSLGQQSTRWTFPWYGHPELTRRLSPQVS